MKTRVISGAVIAVIAVAAGVIGGYPIGFILLVCSMIGYFELCRTCGVRSEGKHGKALEYLGYIAIAAYYLGIMFLGGLIDLEFFTVVEIVLLLLSLLSVYVFMFPLFKANQVMAAMFAFIYCPLLLSFIYRARLLPYGLYIYALIFFCTWICDTGAYFFGRAFGKHKMAPVLSPKKTVEGSVGGIFSSVLMCFLLSLFLRHMYPEAKAFYTPAFIIIGAIGGAVSEIGDLAASAIKRNHNIKDYGNCIPGHGGIMDRFDSVIFTTPIIYCLAVLLLGR